MTKFLVLALSLVLNISLAQNPDYEMLLFNKMDGLGQDYIYTTIQDKRNFLWIGTGNGLARYNGRSIENFTTIDSLQDNFITASAIDAAGNVIFGHYSGGITKYNGHQFIPFTIEGVDKKIIGLSTSKSNLNTWGVTQDGVILKIENEKITAIRKTILTDKVINSIVVIHDIILIGTNEGLVVINFQKDGELSEGEMPETLEWINVTCFGYSENGTIWVGTEDAGIFSSTVSKLEFEPRFNGEFSTNNISALHQDSFSHLWVGTKRKGSFNINLNEPILNYTTFNGDGGYPNFINSIYKDMEGSIWLGTVGEGLVQIVKNQFTHFNFKEKFGTKDIAAGVMVAQNKYLFATDNGMIIGMNNRSTGQFEFKPHPNRELASFNANYLYYAHDVLWFSIENGKGYTYNLLSDQINQLDVPVNGNIRIRSMDTDMKGNIWMSIAANGVYKFDKEQNLIEQFNTTNGFIHNDIFALHADRSDNIWFGAKAAGLAVLRDKEQEIDRLTQKELFPSRDINDIIEDQQGNVWISTDGNGLFKYDGSTFQLFDTTHGLHSMFCGNMVLDINNNLWITHRNGISQINQNKLNKISTYNQSKGVFSINTNYQTLFGDLMGGVWFGSEHELIRYNTESEGDNEALAPFITDLRFFYEKTDLSQYSTEKEFEGLLPEKLKLPHDKNHITFDFIAVSLKRRNSIYYKHRLEGFENKWSPLTTENSATYTNLAPGNYTLLVTASDNQFVWAEDLVKYDFRILKPYWERWWFYLIQILFFIVIITATFFISKSQSRDNKWILRIMVYVCLFITFEYLQNFLEPFTTDYVGGAPLFRILINLVLALILFPVEGLIKKFFYANEKKVPKTLLE